MIPLPFRYIQSAHLETFLYGGPYMQYTNKYFGTQTNVSKHFAKYQFTKVYFDTPQRIIWYATRYSKFETTKCYSIHNKKLHAGTSGTTKSLSGSHYIDPFTTHYARSSARSLVVGMRTRACVYTAVWFYCGENVLLFLRKLSRGAFCQLPNLVVRVPVVLPIVIPSREDRTMWETNYLYYSGTIIVPVVPTRKDRLFPALRRTYIAE